jgi:S-adenosylmethionine:tRNA ribosyltransferase-isomerase
MNSPSYELERPAELGASSPPEERGLERDEVRLLVSDEHGNFPRTFRDLPQLLEPGDLLVVNESATLAASLPAHGRPGDFVLNLSTNYGGGIWLAEPRVSARQPGPVPLEVGSEFDAGGVEFRAIAPFPGIERLWFFRASRDLTRPMDEFGAPIRYGYVTQPYPLASYQTVFSRVPGSSEMPSAGRPFTQRLLRSLAGRGVGVARLWLHTGVSSLESEPGPSEIPPVYPEPFDVPAATADRVNAARSGGRKVVAVGTTVLRALETAWDGGQVVPRHGFTRLTLGPGRPVRSIDGLLTGFHDPRTSHLALLYAFAGEERVRNAYAEAVRGRYLWHEFGDSHLWWGRRSDPPLAARSSAHD